MAKKIDGKQIGKNIIVVIDGKKYSKAIATPEERKEILGKVESYNNKNNAKILKQIINSLSTEQKKPSIIEKVKKVIRPVKKEEKAKIKKEVAKPVEQPITRKYGRRPEY